MSQGAGAEVRMPLSALGPVRHALMTVHTAVGLEATLQAIADGVTTSTPYQEIAVTVAREPHADELHTVAVVGRPEVVAGLLNTSCRRAALEEHLSGGEVWGRLRLLAQRLADAACVARIGGDEFVVVAAGVREADAPELLRRIDDAFAAVPVEAIGLRLPVSSSLGLVCEPGRSGGAVSWAGRGEELLDRADREMYAHKRSRAGVDHLMTLADRP